jgi:hypothetical protein
MNGGSIPCSSFGTDGHRVVLLQRPYLFGVTVVQQFAATSSLDGTYSTQNGLVSAQPVRCEEGSGHVVLCKVLSGSGYRLRPTSKISEFIRDSSLLSKFGISLAEACRAGTRDRWRAGSRERSNGYIVSAARQARCIPGRIRKTSRTVDRPERALVAPTKAKEKSRRRRLKRTFCEIKGGLRRLKVLMARADAGSLLARRATVVLSQHSQVL